MPAKAACCGAGQHATSADGARVYMREVLAPVLVRGYVAGRDMREVRCYAEMKMIRHHDAWLRLQRARDYTFYSGVFRHATPQVRVQEHMMRAFMPRVIVVMLPPRAKHTPRARRARTQRGMRRDVVDTFTRSTAGRRRVAARTARCSRVMSDARCRVA